MAMKVRHKTLGIGTIVPFPDVDGRKSIERVHSEAGIVLLKLDRLPPGCHNDTFKVDIEAITEVEQ